MQLAGRLADGSPYALKLTSRTRKLRIDVPDLVALDLAPLAQHPVRDLYIRSQVLRRLDLSPLEGSAIERLQVVLPAADELVLPAATAKRVSISGASRVELSPIATPALEQLLYNGGRLATVDLKSLAACVALEIVWLARTALSALDLRPLATLPVLRALELAGGKLAHVEFGATGFAALQFLHLQGNPLRELALPALPALRVLNLPAMLRDHVTIQPRRGLEIAFHAE